MEAGFRYELLLDEEEIKLIYDALRGGSFSNEYHLKMSRMAGTLEVLFPHLGS